MYTTIFKTILKNNLTFIYLGWVEMDIRESNHINVRLTPEMLAKNIFKAPLL